jgi:hypothetical protein
MDEPLGGRQKGDGSEFTVASLDARLKRVEENVKNKPKDWWDRFGAISGFLSAVVVAIIGFYAANVYDQRARDVDRQQKDRATIAEELQTVEKFLPDLTSENELKKKGALLAISSLGNTELAKKLADLFGGPGATAALTSIAASSQANNEEKKIVKTALEDLYNKYSNSILAVTVAITDKSGKQTYNKGTGFIVAAGGYAITSARLFEGDRAPEPGITVSTNGFDEFGFPSTLVKLDKDFGVALIKIRESNHQAMPLPLKYSSGLMVGQPITIVGFASNSFRFTDTTRIDDLDGPKDLILATVRSNPGTAGSPVFNETGEVIGMLGGPSDFGPISELIVPIRFIKPLLEIAGAQ